MKKRNKIISIALLSILVVGVATASLLDYFGIINTTVNTEQAVVLTGVGCSGVCDQTLDIDAGTSQTTNKYTATSHTSVDAEIKLVSTVEPSGDGVTSVIEHILLAEAINWEGDGYIGENFEAGRSYITIKTNMTLSELLSIDFEQYVINGYPASVNILLDVNNDNKFESKKDLTTGLLTEGADDVLKIEWAYNGATEPYANAYMAIGDYNTWSFDGVGSIDDTTNAWLYSVMPGPPEIVEGTLAEWKVGINRGTTCYFIEGDLAPDSNWQTETCDDIMVNEATKVYGIQIENLGWISVGQSKVKNININGGDLEDVLTIEAEQSMDFDLEVSVDIATPGGQYDITTNIEV